MALPSEAEITVRYADGTVLHYPTVTHLEAEAAYPDPTELEWFDTKYTCGYRLKPATHHLSFIPKGEYTITAPPELTKAERRAALIREMYPTK